MPRNFTRPALRSSSNASRAPGLFTASAERQSCTRNRSTPSTPMRSQLWLNDVTKCSFGALPSLAVWHLVATMTSLPASLRIGASFRSAFPRWYSGAVSMNFTPRSRMCFTSPASEMNSEP